ncbi:MAG: hypothetical protein NDP13_03390 [Crenarchaeota archaeon]|nr:hypothetical protein [Thermoproteota archaeon]MCR8454013.1 hypothetical protein [Thermoproteota archaeon]MCR8455000.1 hypothetical protein [Thermoproteota archaeon]MCR8463612.1 hypothetical protein [Thermoproteota archaeon]MCR8470448.1 hypothetical protein [Thermoproteota archaeon]
MIPKELLDELAGAFYERKLSRLENVELVLWICWLDRTSLRELRIISAEEDFKVICVHGVKVVIDGKEFLDAMTAIELTEKYYVSLNSATKDDWKMFIERIVEEEHPRVIPGYTFRKRFGLPESLSSFEINVLSIDLREEKK